MTTRTEARAEILNRLWKAIEAEGSVKDLAGKWGVHPSYVNHVWHGKYRPGPSILVPLGLAHLADIAPESHPLDSNDVAQMLGISRESVTRLANAGKLPSYRLPGMRSRHRFRKRDVLAYARRRGREGVVAKITSNGAAS